MRSKNARNEPVIAFSQMGVRPSFHFTRELDRGALKVIETQVASSSGGIGPETQIPSGVSGRLKGNM